MESNELLHYGIKGMKWYQRRYQNKDGSLTPAGRKRYQKLESEIEKLGGKKANQKSSSSSSTSSSSSGTKKISEMDDSELQRYVNRLRNEKDVFDLNRQISTFTAKQKSTGEKIVDKVLNDVLTPAATEAGKRVLTDEFTKIGKEVLGLPTGDNNQKKKKNN